MGMTRLWNITDDPNTEMPPQNLVVLGKLLKPGQSMQVDEVALKKAHKTQKNIQDKLLAVGKATPGYLKAATRASLPAELPRGHGAAPVPVPTPVPAPALVPSKAEVKKEETKGWGKNKR